jgi:hypothetical protein
LSIFQTSDLRVPGDVAEAAGVDVVFTGVEQAGPSYEALVFIGNPGANETTERSPEAGYVGSFSVFGYGEAAPPEMAQAKLRRAEGDAAVAPIEKRVRLDGDLLRDVVSGAPGPTATVVAVPADPGSAIPLPLFEHVSIEPRPDR